MGTNRSLKTTDNFSHKFSFRLQIFAFHEFEAWVWRRNATFFKIEKMVFRLHF
ncbi:hypothetical protein [Kingella negevensis]|uniref:hypothetical protein n=1 Tax=Kingella negevensis TaxID=1522312 RepID=UPI0012FE19DA|nr:hypothetical protein [Kingella negevensis]MDK4688823.1 hypothetical protein [Kingella negevensis]WII90053.1 hypothetical protein QEO93_06055 [Kingella negevensis]